MRTGFLILLLAALFTFAVPGRAGAEWQFAPFLGYTFKASSTLVDWENAIGDTRWNFGGVVTLIGDSPLGVEACYVHTPNFFQSDRGSINITAPLITSSRVYSVMGNVVLATPRSWNRYGLRPYLSGGVGVIHAAHNERRFPVDANVMGINVGGGAVGFLTDRVGLRFDLRHVRNIRGVNEADLDFPITNAGEPVRLRFWTTSIGVVIKY